MCGGRGGDKGGGAEGKEVIPTDLLQALGGFHVFKYRTNFPPTPLPRGCTVFDVACLKDLRNRKFFVTFCRLCNLLEYILTLLNPFQVRSISQKQGNS